MTRADNILRHIDWETLREQKEFCWNESNKYSASAYIYDGLLHLIDSIQDAAVDDHVATEAEIFGEEFE